jgi:uncharacterized protein
MNGIEFATSSGNRYFFDNESGFIYPAILRSESKEFAGTKPYATTKDVESYISQSGYKQLLLETTQGCNMRCAYCCYSERYHNTRTHGSQSMSFETARKALDFFMRGFQKTCYGNPLKKCAISFYGGEPLLNFNLIKDVVQYLKENHGYYEFDYNITTNALLLSDDILSYLTANNFSIIISLDGDKENHDRNRVTVNGSGSFDEVFDSVSRLRKKSPDYAKFGISMCIDYHTDLVKLAEFVRENDLFIVSLNMISDKGVDWLLFLRERVIKL